MKKIGLASLIVVAFGFCMGMLFMYNCVNRGIIDVRTRADILALNCNVNQIFTEEDVDLFIADAEKNFAGLPDGTEIYVVQPVDSIAQYDFTLLQEAEIVRVLEGNCQEHGVIQIVSAGGFYDQKYRYHEYSNGNPLYFGMNNILLPGNQYLVFLTPLEINKYTETKRYRPVFSLFSTFNVTGDHSVPIDREVNTIGYNEFGDSEYFCDTPYTLEHLLAFKHSVLEQYLPDGR